ncbi:NADH dehydrogenase [ubiquinone] 1 alpha subcomplex assembly factor 3 [Nymphon striatum]|nr:NADH dehydrogenase [ubiquinone] 1 alpha subcomplex assembly factor 3 [Nymphon striatum]
MCTMHLPMDKIYRKHELEKKRKYNERVINVEHGTFTPLIFSVTGGLGPECVKYHKHLADKIAIKTGERVSKYFFNHMKQRFYCSHVANPDFKTSVNIINSEDSQFMINSYSNLGFRLNNGLYILGPMAIFPNSVLGWTVADHKAINENSLSLFFTLEPKLDILIIGYGHSENSIRPEIVKYCRSKRLAVEILTTVQRCIIVIPSTLQFGGGCEVLFSIQIKFSKFVTIQVKKMESCGFGKALNDICHKHILEESKKAVTCMFCFINNIVRYKAASSVLQAKDIIQMVIDEVEGTIQLVESCRIYLPSELFITELECLAYFNHFVTFLFLNCVQISSQGQLLELLPKLHNDLIKGKIDTLQNYIVSIHGMPTPTLSNNLSTKIIEMMCATAASAVKLQCGREYGFSEVKLRATDLSLLSEKDLEGLPTNNLVAERDFSRFDREARVAKSRNRRFKAKNIQNNMVLYKCSKEIKIDKLSRTLAAILSCREAQWDVLQHEKLKTRLEAKLNKRKKSEDYTKKLLQNCKSWRGPCTSLEELQQILKEKSDQNVQIVKTELAYYAHTHKADKIANPELFRLNGISHEEKLTNFAVLLSNYCISSCTVADLPTNEDVIATLEERPCQHQISEPTPLNLNKLCAVIWQNCDASYEWYIGYVKSIINNGYIVDHLHRVVPGCHIKWKYPSTEDVQTAELEQILNCTVKGEWDITPDTRKRFFIIENIKAIKAAFHKKRNVAAAILPEREPKLYETKEFASRHDEIKQLEREFRREMFDDHQKSTSQDSEPDPDRKAIDDGKRS